MTSRGAPALGVYVHWPYCARICPYCDFNVVRDRGRADEQAALAEAILADLAAHAALLGERTLVSIFFGGGTPSLMDPAIAARVIRACRALWRPVAALEITQEANPTDAESALIDTFAQAGVNRLSLGVQSLDDRTLAFLGRNHDAATARRAIGVARGVFPRLSVDLIYALPDQSPDAWSAELRTIAGLGADHISPYQLTIEPGTAFHRQLLRGALKPLPQEPAADLYEATQTVLSGAGFTAYEVSNHARGEGARARHNLIYWRGEDYVGVGPGAHGRLTLQGSRWASEAPRSVRDYIAAAQAAGTASQRERLPPRSAALERLLMGLRTLEGVPLADLAPLAIPVDRLEALAPFARVEADRLIATPRGRPVLDRVIAELAG